MKDSFGRNIDYMRISITDRCNLRCTYCMPEGGNDAVKEEELLQIEDIVKVAEAAATLGISKLRITGGEPLVREDVATLIERLCAIEGIAEVNMTTNGVLLADRIKELKLAGLKGVNISLDTMDRARYKAITGRDEYDSVMAGIKASVEAGLNVKINTVLQDESSYKGMLELAKDESLTVRFIELMPLGCARQMSGPSFYDVMDYIRENYGEVKDCDIAIGNGPSRYVSIDGFRGNLGFISPIHGIFCDSCNRIRLTATGLIKPCLCYSKTFNVRTPLKRGDMEELRRVLEESILLKPDRHSFGSSRESLESKSMVSIGG